MVGTGPSRFLGWDFARSFTTAELTSFSKKAELYAVEPTFRETLYHLGGPVMTDSQLGDLMRGTGLALFRPDAIAHDKVGVTLDYLLRFGIEPRAWSTVLVTPAMMREVWRYQCNVASGERLALLDLVYGASPGILVLFAARAPLPVPCAVVMSDTKGEAQLGDREGWELRSHLESPHRIEVYVHAADEPADVVRDGGILLGPARFAEAVAAMGDGTATDSTVDLIMRAADRLRAEQADSDWLAELSPLLRPYVPAGAPLRRWDLVRELGRTCEMYAGPGENIVDHSGSDIWWCQAGMLADRRGYLSSRAGVRLGRAEVMT